LGVRRRRGFAQAKIAYGSTSRRRKADGVPAKVGGMAEERGS